MHNSLRSDSQIDGITIQREVGSSGWFGFAMILDMMEIRENYSLLDGMGVETRPIVAGNFTRNEVIKLMNYEIRGSLDFSDRITTMDSSSVTITMMLQKELRWSQLN